MASLLMSSGDSCHQGICPKGYYCPEGTAWPVVCPAGTYNLNVGETTVDGCTPCIEGYYCPNTQDRTQCVGGEVCPEGVDNNLSVTNLSKPDAGYYSLDQYPDQIPCFFGTFQPAQGTNACGACTQGSQCDQTGLAAVVTCDKGSDCSQAGTIVPKQCDYGMMLDPANTNTPPNPNCIPCKEDNFCWDNAIIESEIDADNLVRDGGHGNMKTTGLCPSGFKCVSGANIIGPNFHFADNPNHYMCREGYYCDNTNYPNSAVEVQCPSTANGSGTYMPYEGAEVVGDCIPCKAGYECGSSGTSTPTNCPAGFYCIEGTVASVD